MKKIVLGIFGLFFFMTMNTSLYGYLSQEETEFIEFITQNVEMLRESIDRKVFDVNHQFGSKKETLLMMFVSKLQAQYLDLTVTNAASIKKKIRLSAFGVLLSVFGGIRYPRQINIVLFSGFFCFSVLVRYLFKSVLNDAELTDDFLQMFLILEQPELDIELANSNGKTVSDMLDDAMFQVAARTGLRWESLYTLREKILVESNWAKYSKGIL